MRIKVYGFIENEHGIMEIENDLKAEQNFVGGRIETYPINDDFVLICNADGYNELEPRAVVLNEGEGEAVDLRGIQQIIHGNCFVCRSCGESFGSVEDEDIAAIKHYVKSAVSITDDIIEVGR